MQMSEAKGNVADRRWCELSVSRIGKQDADPRAVSCAIIAE
jgi:hypothetical protein